MTDIVVYGIGGMGRETAELDKAAIDDGGDWNLIGFVDDDTRHHNQAIADLAVLGGLSWLDGRRTAIAVALGSPALRRHVFRPLQRKARHELPALVPPQGIRGSASRLATDQ